MKIAHLSHTPISFCTNKQEETVNEKNPISKAGERANLLKTTVVGGIALGGKILLEIMDGDIVIDILSNKSSKIASKNKLSPLRQFGILTALIGGFVAAIAALYTLTKTPEIMYKGKVNAFKKGKDMDVYISGNKVEKHLYDQMNDKAKDATPEEKKKLSEQYLKLKAAKNQTPDFIKVKSPSEMKNK